MAITADSHALVIYKYTICNSIRSIYHGGHGSDLMSDLERRLLSKVERPHCGRYGTILCNYDWSNITDFIDYLLDVSLNGQSFILVAKEASAVSVLCVKYFANILVRGENSHPHDHVHGYRREIKPRLRANVMQSNEGILFLPESPHTVKIGMVEEEQRIVDAVEDVSHLSRTI
jgi:hypothetical protein